MARGDWLKSGDRWCHRDDVEPSARELRKGEDRRQGPPVVHFPRAACLLTSEARQAIASALETLRLDRAGRERATEWIACFRSGDWSRVPAWLSVEDTERVYRGIQAAMDTCLASPVHGQLGQLLGAFSPYRFDEDARPMPTGDTDRSMAGQCGDLVTDEFLKAPA